MEREEGELTDEDLEDVSDNSSELSIPIALTGKSPLREPFRELSLTSISDDSDSSLLEKQTYRHISRDLYRKHSHKHRHRDLAPPSPKRARKFPEKRNKRRNSIHRKDYSSVSSSSDDTNYKNKTILRQLRDAVRINRSQNLPNCSLRTRLKRMIEPASASASASQTSNSSDDDNLEILRDQALQSKTKNDSNVVKLESTETNVADEDLAQLRLIALKSAIIKKHAERRKRKEEQSKQEEQLQQEEVEKPHDTPNNQEEPTNENPDNNKSIEEDEDILRAMLLTSISKKIADKKTQPLPNKPNSKPNGLTTQKPNENNYKLPVNNAPINRFIIKVNSDSESDSEQNETPKKPINNHNPKNDIFDKSLSLFLQQARAKTEQDKTKKHQSDISGISHLPRSQQIEYKRLKRKLQILSTRLKPPNKIKKMATNITSDENKKILNNTNVNVNVNSSKNFVVTAQHGVTVTVTEKTRKDERLMIKGKYEELTPLMSRVSEARNARDKTQAEVKRLINNLRIARAQLTANHQEYTVLVQQLVKAKADIDKRAELQQRQKKIIKLSTSTPKKLLNVDENNVVAVTNEQTIIPPQQLQQEQPQQQQQQQPEQKQLEVEQIQQKLQQPELELETKAEPEINEIQMNDDMMDIDETVPEIDIKKEANILKYNSPLEHIQISRKQPLQNPLLELCPYDLLGVCRDADCLYQHCGVTNTTNTITN